MSSGVHNEISKKVKEKVNAIERYKQMDQKRELIISQLITDYKSGKTIDLTELNQWTKEMNHFAVINQLPPRTMVTKEMFETYAKSIK